MTSFVKNLSDLNQRLAVEPDRLPPAVTESNCDLFKGFAVDIPVQQQRLARFVFDFVDRVHHFALCRLHHFQLIARTALCLDDLVNGIGELCVSALVLSAAFAAIIRRRSGCH